MPHSIEARLNAIERSLGGADARLAYSHAQLVVMAELEGQGVPEDEIMRLVGLPADVLQPGDLSHAELLRRALAEERPRPGGTTPEPAPRGRRRP